MIPISEPYFDDAERRYVEDCIQTRWVSSAGEYVDRFEEAFSAVSGARHGVSCSNGTTALHLALLAFGIGPGDEVIVPSFTFVATANAVLHCGATPVFVDVDPSTWTIDTAAMEAAVGPATRALIPVHLYGHPADMEPVLDVAERHGLVVIEDAAESHGARYRGKPVGSMGHAGVFSFYGNKILTTGEGGMVVTNDPAASERLRLLRSHGMSPSRRYWHPQLGYNYRLTNLQAALGLAQTEKMDFLIAERRKIERFYNDGLAEVPGIVRRADAKWAETVPWLYTVRIDDGSGMTRDELASSLAAAGVETRPGFIPIHRQPIYDRPIDLPVSEMLGRTTLSLPTWVGLSEDDCRKVVDAILALFPN